MSVKRDTCKGPAKQPSIGGTDALDRSDALDSEPGVTIQESPNSEGTPMKPTCKVLRNLDTFQAKTGLPYRVGLTQESVGATGLSMHVISIPPGDRALAHKHEGHESMLYVISGAAETFYGERLEHRVTLVAGDLQYIPAGCPHLSINLSKTESCVGVVARTDANEQESVVMLPELDKLVPQSLDASDRGEAQV